MHSFRPKCAALAAAMTVFGSATGVVLAADPVSSGAYGSPDLPVVAEPFRFLDEIRAGVLMVEPFDSDDIDVGVNGELLTSRLPVATGNRFVDFVFGPRLHAGASASFGGAPDYGYLGFTWTVPVTDSLFLEAALGGAVNDDGDNGALGCAFTFREAAAIGYAFDANWRVLLGIEHLSHAGLCGDTNPGLTNVSAKVGYRF